MSGKMKSEACPCRQQQSNQQTRPEKAHAHWRRGAQPARAHGTTSAAVIRLSQQTHHLHLAVPGCQAQSCFPSGGQKVHPGRLQTATTSLPPSAQLLMHSAKLAWHACHTRCFPLCVSAIHVRPSSQRQPCRSVVTPSSCPMQSCFFRIRLAARPSSGVQ